MASHSCKLELANHFSALADDDNDDPSHLIASQLQKLSVKKPAAAVSPAGPPSNSPPPAPPARELRNDIAAPARGGGGRGAAGRRWSGRGGGFIRKGANLHEKGISPKQGQKEGDEVNGSREKRDGSNEAETKEPGDNKEMTLEEYEKVREEKRKGLLSMKVEERKVEFDEDLNEMQQLSIKKVNDEVFIKLGADKDFAKRKENVEKEERGRKAMHIDEFLKPTEGERRYNTNGLGRGRGRGKGRGSFKGGNGTALSASQGPLSIEDPEQFPALGGK